MKKLVISIMVILLLPVAVHSQTFSINYRLGWGSYQMGDLHQLQQESRNDLSVDAKMLQSYPNFFNHQLQGILYRDDLQLGLSYLLMSTGSRTSYKDYSGELQVDSRVKADGIGFFIGTDVAKHDHLQVLLGAQAALLFTRLDLEGYYRIFDQQERGSLEVFAKGLMLEPIVRISWNIKFVELGLEGGYRLNLANEDFHLKNKNDHKLQDSKGNTLSPDWTGYNLGIVAGIRF